MKAKSPLNLAALAVLLALAPPAHTQTLNVLHTFEATDGAGPGALAIDATGNLYGSTTAGGIQNCSSVGRFCGTLFELTKQNSSFSFHSLYQFQNNQDGFSPNSPLTIGPSGILYGSTLDAGIEGGWGTVFSLRPTCVDLGCRQLLWRKAILWAFGECDGAGTNGGLVQDSAGNLYGTTVEMCGHTGQVYELSPPKGLNSGWQKTLVHIFRGPDGRWPEGPVVFDTTGNLYGSTLGGGNLNLGTVYKLALQGQTWSETLLHTFTGPDGIKPIGNLVRDGSGNLYGVTNGDSQPGGAFELTPTPGGGWKVLRLFSFQPGQGQNLASGLVMDANGNMYGVAGYGGTFGHGTVYKLTPIMGKWSYSKLYDFTGGNDGSNPQGPLVLDASGNLYGSSAAGGDLNCNNGIGCGTVWMLSTN